MRSQVVLIVLGAFLLVTSLSSCHVVDQGQKTPYTEYQQVGGQRAYCLDPDESSDYCKRDDDGRQYQ
ncbi:MAG: hypothetical protein A4E19_13970 [Nitrospira sp. SG-bin1]|nr:MAG: hypothetical protein A4E19_13970 [Nitrospira sp. SG-bin1]